MAYTMQTTLDDKLKRGQRTTERNKNNFIVEITEFVDILATFCSGYNHTKPWSRAKNHENHAPFIRPPPLNVAVPVRKLYSPIVMDTTICYSEIKMTPKKVIGAGESTYATQTDCC